MQLLTKHQPATSSTAHSAVADVSRTGNLQERDAGGERSTERATGGWNLFFVVSFSICSAVCLSHYLTIHLCTSFDLSNDLLGY